MIRLLIANPEQYDALNGFTHNSSKLSFVYRDGIGHYVGESVLTDDNFLAIRDQLQELTLLEIESLPMIEEEEE